MSLYPNPTIVRPNQQNQAGPLDALTIEKFTGRVEGTIARRSALAGFVTTEQLVGTDTMTNKGVGEVQLQKLVPGVAPDGMRVDISKASLTVDTVINARHVFPLLETIQTDFNVKGSVADEQGKKHAKFRDQAFFIMAAKTSLRTESAYNGGTAGKPGGYSGGSQVYLDTAGDAKDPAKLYKAVADLAIQMELKDVDPGADDVMLCVGPEVFYTLQQAEQIVNSNYVTSNGTKLDNVPIFKAFRIPVISSNNVPKGVVTNHELSNAANSNAYDGDFSKLVAVAFSPRALMAAHAIELETKVWFDDNFKHYVVDSWTSFGVGPNRAEYAGSIWLP